MLSSRRTGNVTIFGPQAVGKTTFLTVLLQEIKKGNQRRLGLKPLNDEIRDRYRHDYHDLTYGPRSLGFGPATGATAPAATPRRSASKSTAASSSRWFMS